MATLATSRRSTDGLRALTDAAWCVVGNTPSGPWAASPSNVNADAAAGSLARALGAESFVYLTDVEGLFADLARSVAARGVGVAEVEGILAGGRSRLESCEADGDRDRPARWPFRGPHPRRPRGCLLLELVHPYSASERW